MQSHERKYMNARELQLGHYRNAKYGEQRSVRRIVDWADATDNTEC